MLDKPTKRWLKAWGLAEAKTGHVYYWNLYLEKAGKRTDLTVSHHVVKILSEPLFWVEHIMCKDNFFLTSFLQELCR